MDASAILDESDILDLLELQRLTREFLHHLTAMFSVEAADSCGRWRTVGSVASANTA